jgi:hypothetical protein
VNPRIGWAQPHLPGWAPLVDHGPPPLRAASSVARWWWPVAAVSGFLAVVACVFGHDDPTPGLSHRGLVTVALTAVVMGLLTIHRRYGSGSLARAVTEYAVVALLATLLAAGGGTAIDQQPTDRPTRVEAQAQAAAGDDQPAVLQAGATVVRGVTGAARAVVAAVRWLADLWRQADPKATTPKGEAMATSPRSPTPPVLLLRRCLRPSSATYPPPAAPSSWWSPSASWPSPWSPARPATPPSTGWSASSDCTATASTRPSRCCWTPPSWSPSWPRSWEGSCGRSPAPMKCPSGGLGPRCCCAGWARSASTSATPT